jgi:hypothetical protein
MAWLAWRQHRLEGAVVAGVLALVAALLVVTGLHVSSVYDAGGVGACVGHRDHVCVSVVAQFMERFSSLSSIVAWMNLLPGLVGVLLAAPLVLELEQGTYRLVWTQSAPRGRWLLTRLALLGMAALLCGVAISVLFTWWRGPFDRIDGRIRPGAFDFEGIVPPVYVLFAVALALAIGAVMRRTALALAGGFAVYIGVRLAFQVWLRAHLVAPLRLRWIPGANDPPRLDRAWTLEGSIVDAHGHRLAQPSAVLAECGRADPTALGHDQMSACFRRQGVANLVVYQPESRFWLLQGIEAALFLGATAALVALAVWWIRRRLV